MASNLAAALVVLLLAVIGVVWVTGADDPEGAIQLLGLTFIIVMSAGLFASAVADPKHFRGLANSGLDLVVIAILVVAAAASLLVGRPLFAVAIVLAAATTLVIRLRSRRIRGGDAPQH